MKKYSFVMENGMQFSLPKNIVDLYLKTLNKLEYKQYEKHDFDHIPSLSLFIDRDNKGIGMQDIQWAEAHIFPDGSCSIYYGYGYVGSAPILTSDTLGFNIDNKIVPFLEIKD
jgi:hypothetical protein